MGGRAFLLNMGCFDLDLCCQALSILVGCLLIMAYLGPLRRYTKNKKATDLKSEQIFGRLIGKEKHAIFSYNL